MIFDKKTVWSIGTLIALTCILLLIFAPDFYSLTNLSIILTSMATTFLVGLGALFVMGTGSIDVSAGAIYGITAIVAAQCSVSGLPGFLCILIACLLGMFLGAINAVIVTVLRIPSIVATLGTASIFSGALIFGTNGGAWVVGLPKDYVFFGSAHIFGIPVPVVLALFVGLFVQFIISETRFGREVFAVGSSLESSRLAGIPIRQVQAAVFCINGAFLGLAAAVVAARLGQAQTNLGDNITLTAITLAVVGGVSAFGGTGSVIGILLATILVELTGSALIFLHVDPIWNKTMQGIFILAALLVSAIDLNKRKSFISRLIVNINRGSNGR